MKEVSDLIFSVSALSTPAPGPDVTLTFVLANNSPKDYYVVENVVLLSLSEIPFSITGPSIINCISIYSHDRIRLIKIASHDVLENTISISDVCDFSHALPGMYTIKFSGVYYLYTEENKYLYDENELSGEYSYWNAQANFTIGRRSESMEQFEEDNSSRCNGRVDEHVVESEFCC